MDENYSAAEIKDNDDNDGTEEPEFPSEAEFPSEKGAPLYVLVNSGYGKRSYVCQITRASNGESEMTLPEAIVRELHYVQGDRLEFDFDEEEGILYLRSTHNNNDWLIPDWLQE